MRTMAIIFLAALSLAAALAGCGGKADSGPIESGGWAVNRGSLSLDDNPEARTAFDKAAEGRYEPIALLGSQVVAGYNYQILCRSTASVPDAVPTYETITIYADLNGGAEITSSVTLPGLPESGGNLAGGWTINQGSVFPADNEAVTAALETAAEGVTDAAYEAAAFLASQVVAGQNYLLFCRVTPTARNSAPFFAVVTVYADLNGGAEITDVTKVNV